MTLNIEIRRIGRFSWEWRAGTLECNVTYFTRKGAVSAARRMLRSASYRTPWRPA